MFLKGNRTIFSVLLISFLIIPTLSTYFWLHYQKKEIKKEVKHQIMSGLSTKDLVELNFQLHEVVHLQWKRPHEFEYKGRMYDIVYHKTEGLDLTYWCWLDKEETALNAKLDRFLNIALSGNRSRKSKEFELEIFLKTISFQIFNYPTEIIQDINDVDADRLSVVESIYLNISSPPPEIS